MDMLSLVLVMSFLNLTATSKYFDGEFEEPTVFKKISRFEDEYQVDPLGWNYDRHTKGNRKEHAAETLSCEQKLNECKFNYANSCTKQTFTSAKPPLGESGCEKHSKERTSDNSSLIFIKRFVSLLLESAHLMDSKDENEQHISRDIEMSASSSQLKALSDFSASRSHISLQELDSILSDILHKKPIVEGSSWKETFYFTMVQKEVWLYLIILCSVVTMCYQICTVQTVTGFLKIMLILIFFVSYLLEYYRMYKNVEIRQMVYLKKHPEVPSECNPSQYFWLSSIFESYFTFKKEKCEEYYKELWSDPLMEVSPLCVLSSILSDFVLYPAEKVGKAIVVFSSTILGGLPFHLGWFVYIVSSLGIFAIIALAVMILIGGRVSFRGLLCGIEVSPSRVSSVAPPPSPTPEGQNALPSTSTHPMLEAVGKSNNLVLMDASALQTIISSSLIQHRNEIEELVRPSAITAALPSSSSDENTADIVISCQNSITAIAETREFKPVEKKCSVEEGDEKADETKSKQDDDMKDVVTDNSKEMIKPLSCEDVESNNSPELSEEKESMAAEWEMVNSKKEQ